MAHSEFTVEGMSCQHCVQAVTKALEDVQGVQNARVELENKTAHVDYDENQTNEDQLFSAVKKSDYTPVKKN